MQNCFESAVPAAGTAHTTFFVKNPNCLNGGKSGSSFRSAFRRTCFLFAASLLAFGSAQASLDTLTHGGDSNLLSVTDIELSGTSRNLLLATATTFENPVVALRFDIEFENAMDPSTLSVSVETDLEYQVSCDMDWVVIDGDLHVSLAFAEPYSLPAGTVMTVHINDATTPSMIPNEITTLGGIVISDNLEGIRMSGSHHAAPHHGSVPAASTAVPFAAPSPLSTTQPRLYPSVSATAVRLVDLPAGYQAVSVCGMDGSQVASLQLAGRSELVLDIHSLPQGMYHVIIWGAAGRSRLSFLKE
jgi:hypothetical protein